MRAVVEQPIAALLPDLTPDSDTESETSNVGRTVRNVMGFALPFTTPRKTVPQSKTHRGNLPNQTPVSNLFDLLHGPDNDDDEDDEQSMVNAVKQFAHRVTIGGKQTQKKKKVAFTSTAVSELHVKATKILSDLKNEYKELDASKEVEVEYALVDSGSSVHCMNKSKHFLGVKTKKSGKSLSCSTANGAPMLGDGLDKDVAFTTDEGNDCSITFDDLPVSMPIIAVKLLSEKDHRTIFDDEDGGGVIIHKPTKQRTQLIERDGVYFLRMMNPRPKGEAGFARHGHNS